MRLGETVMHVRAWWYLRVAKNATIPSDVGRHLIALRDRNQLAIEALEQKRQAIIDEGAAEGKTISTEAVVTRLLKKATYCGPDREQYITELDRIINEFRKKYGTHIPVDQAYAIQKELEAQLAGSNR
jgi:hypothetical protein